MKRFDYNGICEGQHFLDEKPDGSLVTFMDAQAAIAEAREQGRREGAALAKELWDEVNSYKWTPAADGGIDPDSFEYTVWIRVLAAHDKLSKALASLPPVDSGEDGE